MAPLPAADARFTSQWSLQDAFIGVALKWNIQDIVANTYVKRQRVALRKQAEENLANTREQLDADLAKARRKINQAVELIALARKVVDYRLEDFQIQTNRFQAGLSLEADYLTAKAALAKAHADLFAAQLSHRMAVTDLQVIKGNL